MSAQQSGLPCELCITAPSCTLKKSSLNYVLALIIINVSDFDLHTSMYVHHPLCLQFLEQAVRWGAKCLLMEAALCLVMNGPGRKLGRMEQGSRVDRKEHCEIRQRVGRKESGNDWDTSENEGRELIKKKKSVSLSCPGNRFICIILDSTYVLIYDLCPFSFDLPGGGMNWVIRTACRYYQGVKRQLVGSWAIAHGAQLHALWMT